MMHKKHRMLVLNLSMLVAGMVMLTYASVPLYRLFCQMTGFGGTTKQASTLPNRVIDREFAVRFNADTDQELPWEFSPSQVSINVKGGQQSLAFYTAKNTANQATKGHASYNVVPNSAGKYFNKIECFCFVDQTLQAGQKVTMPVSFFIDPDIEHDPALKDLKTITLSYTFFKAKQD